MRLKNKFITLFAGTFLFAGHVAPPALSAEKEMARNAMTDMNTSTETKSLFLESYTQKAFSKNPLYNAKKNEYEAKRGKVLGAFLPMDPMVGVDLMGQPDLGDFANRTNDVFMVSQSLPFPTKLLLNGMIAANEADMAHENFKEEKRNLLWHIEQPYYELFMIKKSLQVLTENEALLRQIYGTVKGLYESNRAPQEDFLKAQIELSRNGIEIFNLREKEHLAEAHFSHIVNEPLEINYELKDEEVRTPFSYTMRELDQLALEKRPELKAMDIAVQKARANAALTKTAWLPDLEGRIEAKKFRGNDDTSEYSTFIGLSVPVWSIVKGIGGEWQGADREIEAAEEMYLDMKNEVLLKVHEAFSKVKSAENAVSVYETSILPQAKQQVQVGLSSYGAGKTTFLSLMDAQKTLLTSQIEYYKAVAEYEMGLSDLRLAVGDDLTSERSSS